MGKVAARAYEDIVGSCVWFDDHRIVDVLNLIAVNDFLHGEKINGGDIRVTEQPVEVGLSCKRVQVERNRRAKRGGTALNL